MNPINVCKYPGDCIDCISGGNVFVETLEGTICCVANLGVLDEPIKSVIEGNANCPDQHALSASMFIWVMAGLFAFAGVFLFLCYWQKRRVVQTHVQSAQVDLLPLMAFSRSIDSFSEAAYDLPPPPTEHEGLRTYENVTIE